MGMASSDSDSSPYFPISPPAPPTPPPKVEIVGSPSKVLPRSPLPTAARVVRGPNKRAGEKGHNLRPMGKVTLEKKQLYLGILSKTGRLCDSAIAADISYASVRKHMRKDEEFAAGVEEALEIYRDSIDAEVGRRGVQGIEEDIWYQGVVVGQKVVYSDQLLLAHAKAHHPKYKERMEVDKKITATLNIGLESLSEQDRSELRVLLEKKEEERIERENSRSLNE